MKKIYTFGLILTIFVLIFPSNNYFYGAVKNNKDYTMLEVKEILDEFLGEHHPDIKFGVDEYYNYLLEILMYSSDNNLKEKEYYGLVLDYASIYLNRVDTFFNSFDSLQYHTIGQLIDEIQTEELTKTKMQLNPFGNTIGSVLQYDPNLAIAYARKWAMSNNTDYNVFIGNDCTNFVSQILFNANIYGTLPYSLPSGVYDTANYWYFIQKGQYSTTFVRVSDFYAYWSARLHNFDTATQSIARAAVSAGDVVILKNSSTGVRYHTIFISKKENGKAYYCAHTNSRLDHDFDTIDDSQNDYSGLYFTLYKQ